MNSLRRAVLVLLLILLSGITMWTTLNPKPVHADPAFFSGWAGYCTGGSNCLTADGADYSNGTSCTFNTCTVPLQYGLWLMGGSGLGQLSYPSETTFDGSGNLWVVDGNGIEKFSGTPLNFSSRQQVSSGVGDGYISDTCGLSDYGSCVGGIAVYSGFEYLVDPGNNRVQRFLASSENLLDGFDYWLGACAESASNAGCNMADAPYGDGQSRGFHCDTSYCGGYALHDTGAGQFYNPEGIAVDSQGNLYVADTYNNRVQEFTNAGAYIRQLGCVLVGPSPDPSANNMPPACAASSADGKFNHPTHVAVDSSGNVYVADSGNNRVEKFDSSGNFVLAWGSYGSGDDEFNYPTGIAVDSYGDVYVADSGNSRVWRFNSFGDCCGGTYGGAWAGACNNATDIASDLACDSLAGPPNSLHSTGFSCYSVVCRSSYSGYGDGQFNDVGAYDYPSPAGVAVDASGSVYMVDRYNSRVELFAAQHSLTTALLTTGVDRGPGTILVGGVQSPCYAGCNEAVGSSINVTASPSPGWYFDRWSTDDGQVCSTATCTFNMPDNQVTLGATFTQTPITASTPQVSAGTLSGFTEVPVSTVSTPPPAAAGTFPAGLLSFTISGLPIGGTVTVTITLSSPLPPGPFSYWKFHGDTWTELPPSKASLDPTRTVITLTLTDGATPDDSDGKANGVIVDPGGPAVPNLSYVISLVPGWNLISLPLTPISTAIGTVLGSQISSEDFSIIWGYSGGKWSSATQSGGKITGTLTTIQDGLGYWIYMTKADNLTVVSSGFATPPTTPPSYPLGVGWNLVGFTPEPTIGQESTSSYLSSLDGNYGHIYLYDNSLGTWAENPTSLQPGQAVWVYVTAPATLTP